MSSGMRAGRCSAEPHNAKSPPRLVITVEKASAITTRTLESRIRQLFSWIIFGARNHSDTAAHDEMSLLGPRIQATAESVAQGDAGSPARGVSLRNAKTGSH